MVGETGLREKDRAGMFTVAWQHRLHVDMSLSLAIVVPLGK